MKRRVIPAALVALALTASAAVATEGPSDRALEHARGAVAEARAVAQGLTQDPPGQAQKVRAQAAKAAKWEALVAKFAGREHGNAGRVHEALLAGRSPSELAGVNAEAARVLAKANKAMKEAGQKPGRGLGRSSEDATESTNEGTIESPAESTTEDASESVTEGASESVTEGTSESATEGASESATEQASETTTEDASEGASE
jgi:hypothetical protein